MAHKILIIEDQLLIAEDISNQLEDLGYEVIGKAVNRREALEFLSEQWPDLIIADIKLGDEDGIDIITEILELQKVPVIYLTGNSEITTVKKAMKTHPAAFMVKPFKASEFSINIDIAINNFQGQSGEANTASKLSQDSIFIPNRNTFVRIKKEDIFMVEADGSYIKIFTTTQKFQLSSNLKNFESQIKDSDFLRISRKHLINTNHVTKINGNTISVGDHRAVITKSIRQKMLKKFPILKTKLQ